MVLFQRDCRWYCMYVLISIYTCITYLPGSSRSVKCVPKFNQIYYEAGHTSLIFGRSYSERSFEYIHNILYIRVFIYMNMIYIYIAATCLHHLLRLECPGYKAPGHIMEVISLSYTKCRSEILLMLERKILWIHLTQIVGENFYHVALFSGFLNHQQYQHQIYKPLSIQEVPQKCDDWIAAWIWHTPNLIKREVENPEHLSIFKLPFSHTSSSKPARTLETQLEQIFGGSSWPDGHVSWKIGKDLPSFRFQFLSLSQHRYLISSHWSPHEFTFVLFVLVRSLGFQLWNFIFKRSYILCVYIYMYIFPGVLWKQPVKTLTSTQGWWPATGVGKRIELHENRSQDRQGMVVFTDGQWENQWALLRKVVCRCLLERLVTVIKM